MGGNEKLRSKYKENMRVQAEYSEDKKWYDAVILRVQSDGKFLVNFTEYGNSVHPPLCARVFCCCRGSLCVYVSVWLRWKAKCLWLCFVLLFVVVGAGSAE